MPRETPSLDESSLQIEVNGETRAVRARTLGELCAELALAEGPIATAVNGEFVAKAMRDRLVLKEGDRVEIVSPREGG